MAPTNFEHTRDSPPKCYSKPANSESKGQQRNCATGTTGTLAIKGPRFRRQCPGAPGFWQKCCCTRPLRKGDCKKEIRNPNTCPRGYEVCLHTIIYIIYMRSGRNTLLGPSTFLIVIVFGGDLIVLQCFRTLADPARKSQLRSTSLVREAHFRISSSKIATL